MDGPYQYRRRGAAAARHDPHAVYERALEERGIPTYVLGGRGYWSQQQVGDLRAYLAALANPLDELALYSVLASPLGGLSLDSLVILRAAARRRGAGASGGRSRRWRQRPGTLPSRSSRARALPAADADRLRAFAHRFASARQRRRGSRWRR